MSENMLNMTEEEERRAKESARAQEEEEERRTSARELRIALDQLFEHDFQFLATQEEKLERFVMLVSQYDNEVVKSAMLMTMPSSDTGRLPLHLACDKNAPTQVIRWLLDHDVDKKTIEIPDKWGDLPLHTTCSRQNVEVVQLLLESDVAKRTILVKDKHESLPLHTACRYNAPSEVIQLLLESDVHKTTLFEEAIYGQWPLHIACRCNAPPQVIQILLNEDVTKKSCLKQDDVGRLPIHVVLLRTPNLQVVKLLLEGMICHRMHNKGLELWKSDIKSFLKSMKTHERDFNARYKLDVIMKALRELMERAYVLDLAIWRTTCLGREFASMQEIVNLSNTLHDFDADEYKREAHITSGAQIIIPGVMSFLEDEPVTRIIKEIQ